MKRRTILGVPFAMTASAGFVRSASAIGCRGPGLGRGFHLGEVFNRTMADFRQMAAAGATLVRFGIALMPDPSNTRYVMWPAAMQELKNLLGFAAATGIKLVLVLRPEPEPQAPLWHSKALQDSLDDHWRLLARQFAGNGAVAAFDLINESHPPGSSFAAKEQTLVELTSRLVRTVRAVDPTRQIVFEPSPGDRPMAFTTVNKLPFDNIVYSVHMYEPFEFTHQGTTDGLAPLSYPGLMGANGVWNRERLAASLAPVKAFADQHGVQIYVGEFGATRFPPEGSRERYLRDLTSIFEDWEWSWTFHAWNEFHAWDAQMNRDPASRERRESEPAFQVLRQALKHCETTGGKR